MEYFNDPLYKELIIKMENTAIATGVCKSIRNLCKEWNKDVDILDYGTGRARNAKYLVENGFANVSILDRKFVIEKFCSEHISKFKGVYTNDSLPDKKFSIILCNYVLNVIPNLIDRSKVLENIQLLLADDGFAVIEVRYDKEIIKNTKHREPYLDGVIVGTNKVRTFQKLYTEEDFKNYLVKNKFNIKNQVKGGSICYVVQKELIEKQNATPIDLFDIIDNMTTA